MNQKLYKQIDAFIANYDSKDDEYGCVDWEDYLESMEKSIRQVFSDSTDGVEIYTYDVDNDIFSPEYVADELLEFAKDHQIIAYSVNWDTTNTTMIITMIYHQPKGE